VRQGHELHTIYIVLVMMQEHAIIINTVRESCDYCSTVTLPCNLYVGLPTMAGAADVWDTALCACVCARRACAARVHFLLLVMWLNSSRCVAGA